MLLWQAVPGFEKSRSRAAGWLLGLKGQALPRDEYTATVIGHDPTVRGWPWVPNTHSWVEPTALVVLALCGEGLNRHGRAEGRNPPPSEPFARVRRLELRESGCTWPCTACSAGAHRSCAAGAQAHTAKTRPNAAARSTICVERYETFVREPRSRGACSPCEPGMRARPRPRHGLPNRTRDSGRAQTPWSAWHSCCWRRVSAASIC